MNTTTIIDPKVIEKLKDDNQIEDVIDQYVNLKRVGKELKGLCPFHDEKTPSFTVSPSNQLYHCFGCGESGDVLTFLQKHLNIEFFDAVKKLDANIEIGGEKQSRTPKKTKHTPKQISIPGKLIHQPEPVWDCPKPQPISDENWRLISQEEKVPRDRRQVSEIVYHYSPAQQVRRFQWAAADKPKGRDKTIRPFHLNDGEWIPGAGENIWPAYRLTEAMDFISNQSDAAINILMVEGEANVELCREIGLVAVSLKTWNSEGVGNLIKSLQSTGKKIVLGFLYDNDEPGVKKADVVKESCDGLGFPCLLINPKNITPNIIEGGDIQEIVAAIGPEETIKRLEKQFANSTVSVGAEGNNSNSPDSNSTSKRPSADAMGREIAEDYRNKLAFNNDTLCWYRYEADNPGVWSPETDEFIESIVDKILEGKGLVDYSCAYTSNVVKKLRHALIERRWPERRDLIPFENGVVVIATGELLPHSPGYKLTWALPRKHDPVATNWQKISDWMEFATAGNQHMKNILLAFCNATLKGRADIQKFLHLMGIGGSGKGTFTRLLVDLIGTENTHTSTLEEWCGNRFEAAQAYQKRLIIFPDEDKGARSLGKFKSLTGGDFLRAEEKNKKPFKFKFEGMVVVGSNFPIFGGDNSSGIARRLISVPFNAVVSQAKRCDLNETFQSELAAFTNHLLSLDDAWVSKILRGVMDIPEVNLQFWESKIREDSVAGFLNDKLIYDPMGQTSVGDSSDNSDTLYGAYHAYCQAQGHKPQAVKNFSPNLLETAGTVLGWQIEKIHTKIGKVIRGIRLRKPDTDDYIPTWDYELFSRCQSQKSDGEQSFNDSVTVQNLDSVSISAKVNDFTPTQSEKNQTEKQNFPLVEKEGGQAVAEIHADVDRNHSTSLNPLLADSSEQSPASLTNSSPTELLEEAVDFIRDAIAENDVEYAHQVNEMIKGLCRDGVFNRKQLWNALTKEEQSAFSILLG